MNLICFFYFFIALMCAILSFVLMNDIKKGEVNFVSIIPAVLVGIIVFVLEYYVLPPIGW